MKWNKTKKKKVEIFRNDTHTHVGKAQEAQEGDRRRSNKVSKESIWLEAGGKQWQDKDKTREEKRREEKARRDEMRRDRWQPSIAYSKPNQTEPTSKEKKRGGKKRIENTQDDHAIASSVQNSSTTLQPTRYKSVINYIVLCWKLAAPLNGLIIMMMMSARAVPCRA